jgi:hypothetical protein
MSDGVALHLQIHLKILQRVGVVLHDEDFERAEKGGGDHVR